MCPAVEAQRDPHHPNKWAISWVDVGRLPPTAMVQLMPTNVLLTLLLSFHVFLTHKHAYAMFQVRGVVAMATKHRDGRGKRPRSEVNACP